MLNMMKKASVLLWVFTLFFFSIGKTQVLYPSNPDSLGRLLCASINLNMNGLQTVRSFANQGKYESALLAWRDYKVMSLRQNYLGQFGWHSNQLNASSVLPYADYMTEKISKSTFLATACPQKNDFVYFGFSGSTDSLPNINWLAKNASGVYPDVYANFYNLIPLASNYYKTGDIAYLKKWFQVTANFACVQKPLVDSLDAKSRALINCNWSTKAQPALSQSDRVQNIIKALGVICKSLPNGGKPAKWDTINNPLNQSLATSIMVPAVELSQIAFSLVFDHPTALKSRFFPVGAVPNQRRAGLTALLLIATQFPEFTLCNNILDSTSISIDDYLNGAFYADGGMLEQSFNYNLGDAAALGDMVILLKNSNPSLSQRILSKQIAYYQLSAALRTPIGNLPAMSSQSPANPTPIWKDSVARKAWLKANYLAIPGQNDTLVARIAAQFNPLNTTAPPSFTSKNYPYSGYYVQRKNWNWDSHYLFFQDCRPARGHVNMGHNAIQVSAFGRPLLVSAGPPVYDTSQLVDSLVPDFNAINNLLGETSSLKVNTIIVDGKSQIPGNVAQTAYTTPIDERWHSSANFDFLEGNYTLGYPTPGRVNHRRQVIFVRSLGCWIVTDILSNLDKAKHSFTQIWNFLGYQANNKTLAYGFQKNQMVLDAKGIHTNDSTGPNILLYHIGGNKINDTLYFGQKNPYLGWFSPTYGNLIPAPQVFSTWKSNNNSVMTTIIWPTQTNAAPPYSSLTNLSDSTTSRSGFSMKLNDGRRLDYLFSYNKSQLNNDFKNFNTQSLLTFYAKDSTANGLSIGEQDSLQSIYEYKWANGQFTVDTNSIVLPIKFLSFTAVENDKKIKLFWQIANAGNATHFIVQYSKDGVAFENIGTLKAENQFYTFTHPNPALGNAYYRLKVVGSNGTIQYSNTIFVFIGQQNSASTLSVYPNPSKSTLNVSLQHETDEMGEMQIVAMNGVVIFRQKWNLKKGINYTTIPITNLSKGTYTLIIKGKKTMQKSFMKD